jgi:two-component system LytT family response regulator
MIHAGSRKHLVGMALSKMECRFPKPPFLRVHRSHIVNLDHVDRVIALDDSRMEVRMKDGAVVPVSRARSKTQAETTCIMEAV